MARLLRVSDMSLHIFNPQLCIALQTYLTMEFFFYGLSCQNHVLKNACLLPVLQIYATFVKQENLIWDPQKLYFRESVAFLYSAVYYFVYFSRNMVSSFHQHLKGIPQSQQRLKSTVPWRKVIYVKASIFPLINSTYVLQGQLPFIALPCYDFYCIYKDSKLC